MLSSNPISNYPVLVRSVVLSRILGSRSSSTPFTSAMTAVPQALDFEKALNMLVNIQLQCSKWDKRSKIKLEDSEPPAQSQWPVFPIRAVSEGELPEPGRSSYSRFVPVPWAEHSPSDVHVHYCTTSFKYQFSSSVVFRSRMDPDFRSPILPAEVQVFHTLDCISSAAPENSLSKNESFLLPRPAPSVKFLTSIP